jgi:hypothetical protein
VILSEYEKVRRHLDPVREYLEKNSELEAAFVPKHGHASGQLQKVGTQFMGAYLRDDLIVIMVKFDDKTVDSMYLDDAYEAIRLRYKNMLSKVFMKLEEKDMAIHVIDTSGNIGDIEF